MNRVRLGLLRRATRRVTDGQLAKATASLVADGHPLREAVAYPAPVVGGGSLFNRADASERPRLTPSAPPAPPTRPIPGLAPAGAVADSRPRAVRPFVSAGAPKALLFDALAAELPLPPAMSAWEKRTVLRVPAPAGGPGCDVELYSAPGWTQDLTARRVRDGWWEDPQAGLDQIATRTAAGFTTARGHLRETLAGGWRSVRELAGQDRNGTGPQHAVGGAS